MKTVSIISALIAVGLLLLAIPQADTVRSSAIAAGASGTTASWLNLLPTFLGIAVAGVIVLAIVGIAHSK